MPAHARRLTDQRLWELERAAKAAGSAVALELVAEVRRLNAQVLFLQEVVRSQVHPADAQQLFKPL